MLRRTTQSRPRQRRFLWFERIMAAIALINFVLVLFDYSYIPLRDYYLQLAPGPTKAYGEAIKGIEPDRTTDRYLRTVEQVAQSGLANGVDSYVLTSLRQQSRAIIDENPFEVANKTGTLERIKRRMVDRINLELDLPEDQQVESSKEAFDIFWSQEFLTTERYNFFYREIKPLFETNYYRNITAAWFGTSGIPVNRFIIIDIGFILLFAAEFLLRSAILSRRHANTNWLDAMLWRWYDIPLLLPFWQWLRAIPVVIRINQSKLIDLEPIRNRLTRGILASVAVELTEVVILRVIDQVQNMLQTGDMRRTILDTTAGDRYIDLNGVDELQLISQRVTATVLHDVLPKIRPDIELLIQHTVRSALSQNFVYAQIQNIPGVADASTRLSQEIATQLYDALRQGVINVVNDEQGAALTRSLIAKVGSTFREEIQQDQEIEEIEALLGVWLEEIKINYVQRLAEEDIESLQEQTQKIYAITRKSF
ncbi:MAG: hypothetical protein F6K30_01075 [Cyanothece sp. SIO2G6]|nr:hypothetical protein [Cyanothece sp. SIO2G6]